MRYKTLLLSAIMLFGISAPALADHDYDDYRDYIKDRNEDYRDYVKKQQKKAYKAYRNGYSVRTVPGYYYSGYGSRYTYPSYGYYRDRSLVGGILDWVF